MEHTQASKTEELLQHHRWARSLARHLVADEATADDVAQESMVIALEHAPAEVRSDSGLKSWLGTVVRNVVRQRGRSEGRRAHREEEAASQEPLPSALEMTAFAEGQELLLNALLTLDEESRHMVLLRYQEGLSAAEIARRQGKGSGTVRSKIKRALERLRAELDEAHGGDRTAWHAAVAPLTLGAPTYRVAAGGSFKLLKGAAGLLVATAVVAGLVSVLSPGTLFDGRKEAPGVLLSPVGAALSEAELGSDIESPSIAAPAAPERQPVSTSESTGPAVEAKPSETKTGRVRLRLVDDEAQPIAGVEVTSGRQKPVVSTADGRVELDVFLGLETTKARLSLTHQGHAADVVTVLATRGQTVDAGDHVLRAGSDIVGRVLDPQGLPLAGMIVSTDGLERRVASSGGISTSTSTPLGRTEATTDSNGQFELGGVLAGEVDVHVESEDGLWTGSAKSVRIRANVAVRDLVITASKVPLDTRIEGLVVDHMGKPAPYASIRMKWRRFFSNSSASSTADAEGRFGTVVPSGVSVDMWFTASGDSLPRASLEQVDAGSIELIVQLTPPRTLKVLVTTDDGAPIQGAEVWVSSGRSSMGPRLTNGDGLALVSRPIDEFTLLVHADGYAAFEEEYRALEFDRSDAMALPVQLAAIPRLEGVVQTAEGTAFEGAALSVHPIAQQKTLIEGLPSLVENRTEASGQSDSGGAFAITLRESGDFMLRAEGEGYAPAEFGPFHYDPADGLKGIALKLSEGGSVKGRVLDGDQVRQRHIVMLSRGDGHVATVRTDLNGDYRFSHVAPGPCFVRVVPEMIRSGHGSSSSTWGKPYVRIEGDVFVGEGATSRFDLVIGKGLPPVTLLGQLSFSGLEPARFRASLVPEEGHQGGIEGIQPQRVNPDGSFQMRGDSPGRYTLQLVDTGARNEAEALRFAAPIDLAAGINHWSLKAAFCSVTTGAGADPALEKLLWRGPAGAFAIRPLANPGQACTFPSGTISRVPELAMLRMRELLDLDDVEPLESVTAPAEGQVTVGQ